MNIISRAEWGARPPRRRRLLTTPTSRLWLHHLATDAWHGVDGMQACQNFHMDDRDWDDIGYSFLVDEDGTVFEGRGAGVIGGHTAGDNSGSHAICVMGNFQARAPSDAVLATVAELVRFGSEQGWWPSALTGGHRDARPYSSLNATACPGEHLYALIPHINALAGAAPIPQPEPQPQPQPQPPPPQGVNDVNVPYLRQGSTGSQVKAMQGMLRYKGGNHNLAVDGDFGPNTDHWIRDFQSYYNLGADGIVGPITWQALVDV